MKQTLLVFTLILSQILADVSMRPTPDEPVVLPIEPVPPIARPPIRPDKPIRPKEKYLLMHQENYYHTNVVAACDQYIKIIKEKDAQISALKKEVESLRKKEQANLQKSLKEAYDKEMEKFENRGGIIHSRSKAVISDKPIE